MCALSALKDNFNALAHTEKFQKVSERERAELLKAAKHTHTDHSSPYSPVPSISC